MLLELVFISLKTSKGNDTDRDTEKGSEVSGTWHVIRFQSMISDCVYWPRVVIKQ